MRDGNLYQKALPFWVGLAILSAALWAAGPERGEGTGGGRLLAGIEPITVIKAILQHPRQLGQVMLCFGLPTLARQAGEQDPLFRDDTDLISSFLSLSAGIRYHTPQETLRAGLPILGFRTIDPVPLRIVASPPPTPGPAAPSPSPDLPAPTPPPAQAGRATVIIFHTHTSECYQPISGREHLDNGAGDIVQAGEYLAQALEADGLDVVHDRTINDQIPFRDAYKRSLNTAEKLLAANPNPLALIDLHRDATPGVANAVTLGGEKVARIALVVGTDRLGLPHPHWRENLAFANGLRDAAERLYPGLLARIDVQDARYNQHLHPRAIIVEIGDQYSTAAEIYRAAACLARILAEVAPAYQTPAPTPGVPAAGQARDPQPG